MLACYLKDFLDIASARLQHINNYNVFKDDSAYFERVFISEIASFFKKVRDKDEKNALKFIFFPLPFGLNGPYSGSYLSYDYCLLYLQKALNFKAIDYFA